MGNAPPSRPLPDAPIPSPLAASMRDTGNRARTLLTIGMLRIPLHFFPHHVTVNRSSLTGRSRKSAKLAAASAFNRYLVPTAESRSASFIFISVMHVT
jgi:hypothetical protein